MRQGTALRFVGVGLGLFLAVGACVGDEPDVSLPATLDAGVTTPPGGDSGTGSVGDASPSPGMDAGSPIDAAPPKDATVAFGVLTTDQERLEFGDVDVGQTVTRSVKVTNTGTKPIAAPTIASSPTTYAITANTCQTNLGIGAECVVEVTFTPAVFGVVPGTLTFSDDSGPIKQVLLAATGRQSLLLSVEKAGTGTGLVRTTDGTIACGADCEESITSATAAGQVTLIAEPSPDSSFTSWEGCVSSGPSCVVSMDVAKTVKAIFTRDKRALRLEYVPDQPDVGAVSSLVGANPGPVACAGACDQVFYLPDDITVVIQPPTATSYRFTDACSAVNGQGCTVQMTADRRVQLRASKYNYAFVTSTTYTGDLGGVSGADQKCNERAAASGLPGTFKAYLSSTVPPAPPVPARDRVTKLGGFIRVDKSIFTRDATELKAARYRSPLWLDEAGQVVDGGAGFLADGARVWSGTQASGTVQTDLHCEAWTSASASMQAVFGGTRGQRHRLLAQNVLACNQQGRLYCLGDDLDREVPLPTVPTNARRIFVTSTIHAANLAAAPATMDAYDAICRTAASTANLGNDVQFAALLPSETQSPVVRLGLTEDAPWVGIDGVPIAATAADFLDGKYAAGLQLDEQGAFLAVYEENTFTGYHSATVVLTPRSPVEAVQTCSGWTSNSDTLSAGIGRMSDVSFRLWSTNVAKCNTSRHLICIEKTVRP